MRYPRRHLTNFQDQHENERIDAWHKTFNAFVTAAITPGVVGSGCEQTMREVAASAEMFADIVHGKLPTHYPADMRPLAEPPMAVPPPVPIVGG